jgi:hypothetical protein
MNANANKMMDNLFFADKDAIDPERANWDAGAIREA